MLVSQRPLSVPYKKLTRPTDRWMQCNSDTPLSSRPDPPLIIIPCSQQLVKVRTGTPPVSPRDPRRPRRRLHHSLRRAIDRVSGLGRNLQPASHRVKTQNTVSRRPRPNSQKRSRLRRRRPRRIEADREVGASIGAVAVDPRARRRVPPGPRLHERASPLWPRCAVKDVTARVVPAHMQRGPARWRVRHRIALSSLDR
jgi:hypothetical protein